MARRLVIAWITGVLLTIVLLAVVILLTAVVLLAAASLVVVLLAVVLTVVVTSAIEHLQLVGAYLSRIMILTVFLVLARP